MPRYSVSVVLLLFAVMLVCPPHASAQTWVDGVGPMCTPVEFGRLGLVRNVHAYDQGGVAVAPVRGIAEVLGASVEYRAPKVVVHSADGPVTLEIEPGSRTAFVNGRAEDMGARAASYSGITCAPVRFVAGRLGATVQYRADWGGADFAFGSNPRIAIGRGSSSFVVLVHEQPPDAVAQFVADLENGWQAAETIEPFYLGTYGVDWIVQVARLASDGRHFLSSCPERWNDDSPLAPEPPDDGVPRRYVIGQGYVPPLPPREPRPGFWGNAAAIYGIREGTWRYLIGTQDVFPFKACERVGIPRAIVRELDPEAPYYAEDWAGFTTEEPLPPVAPPRPLTAEPEARLFLTLDNARDPVHVGNGYFVSGLNFVGAFEYVRRGARILGQVLTPAFEETDRPISIEMTLTAFDSDLRVLGSTSISFHSVPSHGGLLPFEATLYDVAVGDIACVSILPKGAWVIRD